MSTLLLSSLIMSTVNQQAVHTTHTLPVSPSTINNINVP